MGKQRGGGSSDSRLFRIKHEYIVCYAKSVEKLDITGVAISNEDRYKLKDQHESVRGPYYLQKLGMGSIQYSQSLDYPIQAPDGTSVYPADNNNGKRLAGAGLRRNSNGVLKMISSLSKRIQRTSDSIHKAIFKDGQ